MRFPAFLQNLLTAYFRWVALGLVVIVVALGYFLVLQSKITNLRTSGILERANVEAELKSEQDFLQKLQASIQQFQTKVPADQRDDINGFIPTGSNFPDLLLTVEAIARSAGLQLEAVAASEVGQVSGTSPTDSTDPNTGASPAAAATIDGINLRTQDITLQVSGGTDYQVFKRFIALIESSRRLLDVVSLGFDHQAQGENVSDKAYTVVVRTYYLPETTI